MGRKVKVQITSAGKHYVMGENLLVAMTTTVTTTTIVFVAMTTNAGEIVRESIVEPSKIATVATAPVVKETVPGVWSYVRGQRSLEGLLLALVVCVVGLLLARHWTEFITLLATPT